MLFLETAGMLMYCCCGGAVANDELTHRHECLKFDAMGGILLALERQTMMGTIYKHLQTKIRQC